MNSKRQCDLFGHTAPYINTSLPRLAIDLGCFLILFTLMYYAKNVLATSAQLAASLV